MVFFPNAKGKLGVAELRPAITAMNKKDTSRAILIMREGLTSSARQALEQDVIRVHIEQFKIKEMLIDITEHVLVRRAARTRRLRGPEIARPPPAARPPRQVPEHIVLTPDEKAELLKRYKLDEKQLPRIQRSDPVARFYGMKRGQVVKIVRPSETAGQYVTYRLVE